MIQERRYQTTIRALRARWPAFLAVYGGFVLALILIGISLLQGWLSLIPFSFALMILLGLYLAGRVWSLYHLYSSRGIRPHDMLFDMGQIQDIETLVFIDHGERHRGLNLLRRFTLGKIIFIDIYNPQWMPNPMIVRQRQQMPTAVSDPRLEWNASQFGLLPLPDESVSVVMVCETLSELAQRGDQLTLLKEVNRILRPYGRLLFCERTSTRTNRLLLDGFALKPTEYWHQLLKESGLVLQKETEPHQLINCYRAIKPTRNQAKQMALDLIFDH